LSCLVLSCLVLSCLVLSCLVLSCLVLSCLIFAFVFCFGLVLGPNCHFPPMTYFCLGLCIEFDESLCIYILYIYDTRAINQDLCAAAQELQRVGALHSAEELCDILALGRHRLVGNAPRRDIFCKRHGSNLEMEYGVLFYLVGFRSGGQCVEFWQVLFISVCVCVFLFLYVSLCGIFVPCRFLQPCYAYAPLNVGLTLSRRVVWCRVVSCRVVSYRVMSCLLSCRVSCLVLSLVLSCLVVSCRVVWCHVVSCRVVSCLGRALVVSCLGRVVPCLGRVVSCLVLSCRVVSCHVVSLSCRAVSWSCLGRVVSWSCRVVSCRVVPCRVLVVSCRVVSCLVVFLSCHFRA
jgi:hypothetical protein